MVRYGAALRAIVVCALVVAGVTLIANTVPAQAAGGSSCGPTVNPVACENRQAGNPASEWDVSGAGDPSIQGFSTDISVNAGNTVSFKIKTTAAAYTITIYRLGYYGGLGARKVATVAPSASLPQTQPDCLTDSSVALVDCGDWAVSASWAVPSAAVSGVYLAHLTRTDTGGASLIPFIVRNDASTSDIVYQTSDPTWEAYNRYGDADFYTGSTTNLWDSPSRARKISYNRPFATRGDASGRDFLFSNEYPTIRFLERNGYDVSYISGVDTDRYGATQLPQHRVFLSVGHDEYWSQGQRTNVEKARDAGVNLMFLSGNEVFWHTRYEASIDGSNTAYRTLVCYKETWDNAATDPSGEATATWRDPRFSAAPGGTNPENALTGTMYRANSVDLPLTVTADQGKDRLWRNTGLASMTGASTTIAQHIIGYESDEDVDNGFRNAGQVDLSTTTGATSQYSYDFGQNTRAGTTTHHLTLYRAASGALVFGAGTVQWGWGLDANHDGTATTESSVMQQAMINMLADMKAQPSTLMAGLVPAGASTDTTAPTSTITSPAAGTSIANGTSVTVTGTATDTGGTVAGVEVSLDGGSSWHPATGTASWSYTGIVHGSGNIQILARATDDSLNTQSTATSVTVSTSCPCTLFGAATPATPDSGDASRAELGVRFSPDTTGFVTGMRFYKSAANTGTHTGSLWSSTGTLLATGTFTNETASGWQTLQFAAPVAVSANATYVVGYWAPSGHYAEDDYTFYYRDYLAAPLRAQANSATDASRANGVYSATNGFPTQSYLGANYYVDPLFVPAAAGTPTVVTTNPISGGAAVPVSATPSATFSNAVDPASITMTVAGGSGPVAGSVGYDAPSQTATFTPSKPLPSGTLLTATVLANGTNGSAMPAPYIWTFTTGGTVSCPCSLFASTATPGVTDSGDRSAVSVGVRFSSSTSGYVTGARFYKATTNGGTHTASVWSSTGTRLATATFTAESASGWQTVSFSPAVAVTAGVSYVVSVYDPQGRYAEDDHFFDAALLNGPLTAPSGAGVYSYGGDVFPSSSYANANYWIDPVFNTVTGPAGPTVTSTGPAGGATGVPTSTAITAVVSKSIDPTTVVMSVTAPGGAAVGGTTTYADGTRTVTFTPSSALDPGTTYAVSFSANGADGSSMSSAYTWSFTTAVSCPCGLFTASATPSTPDAGDGAGLTVGVQFAPSIDGAVTGVRFYKSVANTGTHLGSLWSSTGTLLATGTFTNETASGWQRLTFDSPVAVTAGTTYVVSYYAPNGHYSEDDHYFDNPVTRPPLTAPAGAGVYAYGAHQFPSSTYLNANYWVDPVFAPLVPTVTATAPANGATGVAVGVTPSATFSQPVTTASIQFTLTAANGTVVPGSVTYDATSQKATFAPASPLSNSTTYTASVSATGTNGVATIAPATWTFSTVAPPDTTPPVISAVAAQASGGTATVTWVTDEASTSRVDYGPATAGALTSSATAGGSVTAHSVTLTGLAPNTRYSFRITSADASGNAATSPAPPAAPASFAPAVAPAGDTTTADFSGGTLSSAYVSTNGDGEVVSAPSSGYELTGSALPPGLTSRTLVPGGGTTLPGGTATVSGAVVSTTASFGTGRAVETSATLGRNQSIGWTTPLSSAAAIAVSVNAANQLVATVNDGFTGTTTSVLANNWTTAPHVYRVDLLPSSVAFSVDGAQLFAKAFVAWFGSTYKPALADSVTTDGGLLLRWIRVGPYAPTATFTSRILDQQAQVVWDSLSWDATVPAGTTLVVQVRTGNTAAPDPSWSPWAPVPTSGGPIGRTSRYLQYRLILTTSGTRLSTPAVRQVQAVAHV